MFVFPEEGTLFATSIVSRGHRATGDQDGEVEAADVAYERCVVEERCGS